MNGTHKAVRVATARLMNVQYISIPLIGGGIAKGIFLLYSVYF